MNIITLIAQAGYAATEEQVENLAHAVVIGKKGESTYLRILAKHVQAEVPNEKKATAKVRKAAQNAAIDKIHTKLYPHVQRGVQQNGMGPDQISAKEINRRATFARTSASELRGYVRKGGSVLSLDIDKLTRQQLRNYGMSVPTGTRTERAMAHFQDAILRAAKRIAKTDPAEAKKRLQKTIDKMQSALEQIEAQAAKGNAVVRRKADKGTGREQARAH